MGATEIAVIIVVIGLRLLLPLTIPYFPIVGVVSCLLLDAVDQTIFQQFPAIPLDSYQSYDKALDIYYLTITYLSTFRNWTNQPAFRVNQALFYYRLVGVAAFELTQIRALLLVFPNTFEYFFIFYELVRMRWDPARMSRKMVIVAAALIWVFIKLPQEWWIHIAQLDTTDFIKEELFGVDLDTSWTAAVAAAPLVLVAAVAVFAALAAALWWVVTRKAPPADHAPQIKADPLPPELRGAEPYRSARVGSRIFDRALAEKAALAALVCIIFANMLPGLDARPTDVAWSVALFVVANAAVSQWLARRGRSWTTVAVELGVMAVVNFALVVALEAGQRFLGLRDAHIGFVMTLFFVLLLTVIIVLFDRYHTVYAARRLMNGGAPPHSPRSAAISP